MQSSNRCAYDKHMINNPLFESNTSNTVIEPSLEDISTPPMSPVSQSHRFSYPRRRIAMRLGAIALMGIGLIAGTALISQNLDTRQRAYDLGAKTSPACQPRPECLDYIRNKCELPTPVGGWCPTSEEPIPTTIPSLKVSPKPSVKPTVSPVPRVSPKPKTLPINPQLSR